mmetsp:Transcript_10292/g.22077  ORF Transcript_10292/g.22077 Transcript_10292/m.22077 type:complete len:226 (+) Transcript_10292:860-1537(+)
MRSRQGTLLPSNILLTCRSTLWSGSSLFDQPSSTRVVTTTAQMWPGRLTWYSRTSSSTLASASALLRKQDESQLRPSVSMRLISSNVCCMAVLKASGSGHACSAPEKRSVQSPHARPSSWLKDLNSPTMLSLSSSLSSVAMPTSSSTSCGCSQRCCRLSIRARMELPILALFLTASRPWYTSPTSPAGGLSRTRMLPGCRSEWIRLSTSIICSMVPEPSTDSRWL